MTTDAAQTPLMDELTKLDLLLFVQGTDLKLQYSGSDTRWKATAKMISPDIAAIGYGNRPWTAVQEAYNDACRKMDLIEWRVGETK